VITVTIDAERCKNCGFCEHFCPKNAISESEYINKAGYRTYVVEEGACIQCGICYTVCPDHVFNLIETEVAK
jgi:2-oxoglutarate ferredoxin oxidoreductase subunit delta